MEENEVKEVVEVEEKTAEELTPREKYAAKSAEMREKYVDAINDIAIREGKDVGVAFEMLKAIPRAIVMGEEPLYTVEVEINMDELVEDYKELLRLSNEVLNG